MEDKLRQLQCCEREILDELVRICDAHGLRYYLTGGTLLGAVRHEGFIPWDDDIDVAMPREDYERFARICEKELDGRYFYQSAQTDGHYFLSYAKLRRNGTEVSEDRFRDAKFHKGVFIDIFPLDPCPSRGLICHLLFNVLAVMNRRGEVDSGEKYEPYEELSGRLGFAFLWLFSPEGIVKLRRRLIALGRRLSGGAYVACYSGAYGYRGEVFPSSWYAQGATLPFEGREYRVPAMPHEVLNQLFGETYLVLPPVSERTCHTRIDEVRL